MKNKRNKGAGRKLFDGKPIKEVIQKLEDCWAMDCSDVEAAAVADISSAALCDFLKKHPDISERKARLKNLPFHACRKSLLLAVKEGNGELALKYLERKLKKEFAPKSELDVKGDLTISDALRLYREQKSKNAKRPA